MFIFWVCVVLASVSPSLAGYIQSPGFPHGYHANLSVSWRRCAPPGHVLSLTLLHLDLEDSGECEDDVLEISKDGYVLANLCGKMTFEELQSSVNPSLRSSSGGCLFVGFYSDNSNPEGHAGFNAIYTTPANCTENRYGAGVLTSPGSPGPYYEDAHCLYSLSVDEGNQIELKFTGVFDVESINGRCIDFVKVKTDTETFGPFCGKDRPADIHTAAQHVQVIFRSDLGGTNQGFSLQYGPKVMDCSGKVTPHSTVSPVKERYTVGEKVTVRCEQGYILDDTTDSFTSTCQLNGKWSVIRNCESANCRLPELSDPMVLNEKDPEKTFKHKISVTCSTHYYNLVGNANFTCDATGEWVAENGQNFSQLTTMCVPVCGMTKSSAGGRIFGGKSATLGQIPWQLLVKEPNRGGASLINDFWAITAAHVVVVKQRPLKFIGGMVDAQSRNQVEMETDKIIIHPGYDYTKSHYDNDIALVKMSSRVPLSENIMPVCLPERKSSGPVMEGMHGTVSGFGATSDRRQRSRYLQYGNVKEYSGHCFNTDLKVTENMFCAGDTDGQVDSCKGDGGGPLVIPMLEVHDTPYRLKGIVSWGPPACGDESYKGYYTKVENYLDWIRETMEKN
ncbi:complement C1s subcomponent-like [Clarias magur]|uniref:Complement C1s subcomponent-like n=1 Tax=Clarias magur TaxID=1594786 RepID=A0A8J4TXM7_CLAMG|nr:complement C1s subcomponent-like [Clarias magur]